MAVFIKNSVQGFTHPLLLAVIKEYTVERLNRGASELKCLKKSSGKKVVTVE